MHEITINIPGSVESFRSLGFEGETQEAVEKQFELEFGKQASAKLQGFGKRVARSGEVKSYWMHLLVENVENAVSDIEVLLRKYSFPNGTKVFEVGKDDNGQDYLITHILWEG